VTLSSEYLKFKPALIFGPGFHRHLFGDGMERGERACLVEDAPSFVGMPKARADASICDRVLGQSQVLIQEWLRTAVANGWVGDLREGPLPRYVWYCDGDVVYEGRLVNRQLGECKVYPFVVEHQIVNHGLAEVGE
jgi:hypothetical protein